MRIFKNFFHSPFLLHLGDSRKVKILASDFIHCSDMARWTPLPYSQFSNNEKNAERFEPKNMVLRNYLEAQNDSGTRLSKTYCYYKRNQGQNRLERCGRKNIRRKPEAILAGKM